MSLAEKAKSSPKQIFAYLKRRNKAGSGIPPLKNPENQELLTDAGAKADLLASFYAFVYTSEEDCFNSQPSYGGTQLHDIPIDEGMVMSVLLRLKPSTSPGPDEIHPLFLKEMAMFLAEPLSQIFRLSLDSGHLPVDWKTGVIKPIFTQ